MCRCCMFVAMVAAVVGIGFPGVGHSQTVAIQSSRDTSIFEESGNSNGAGGGVFIGNNRSGNARRGLVFFDIAGAVPAGATIEGVSLSYSVAAPSGRSFSATSLSIHRALLDWGEAGSSGVGRGAPAEAGDATWQQASFDAIDWANAGGDFVDVASESLSVSATGMSTANLNGLIADLQLFLDSPNLNFGFFLIGDESSNQTAVTLGSREATDVADRPWLTISYSGVAVPEPSSMLMLVVVGGFLGLGQRRKG